MFAESSNSSNQDTPNCAEHMRNDLSGDIFDDTISCIPGKTFQVDVLLLTRRSLSPSLMHRVYETGLVEVDKMSQRGWRSADYHSDVSKEKCVVSTRH